MIRMPDGIPIEADKAYLSLEVARDEVHRKLVGRTVWSDVDAHFDVLPEPPHRQASEHDTGLTITPGSGRGAQLGRE
jgi:hypothetical protein